jgi:hypothetical protein
MLHGGIQIGYGLRLNPLGSVYEKKNTLARSQGAGDFIGKIRMTRSIDKVELEFLTRSAGVGEHHGLAFYGDASFSFDFHIVEDLVAKLPLIHHAGVLDQPVGQCGFSMIDMGNNAEISDLLHAQLNQ